MHNNVDLVKDLGRVACSNELSPPRNLQLGILELDQQIVGDFLSNNMRLGHEYSMKEMAIHIGGLLTKLLCRN